MYTPFLLLLNGFFFFPPFSVCMCSLIQCIVIIWVRWSLRMKIALTIVYDWYVWTFIRTSVMQSRVQSIRSRELFLFFYLFSETTKNVPATEEKGKKRKRTETRRSRRRVEEEEAKKNSHDLRDTQRVRENEWNAETGKRKVGGGCSANWRVSHFQPLQPHLLTTL